MLQYFRFKSVFSLLYFRCNIDNKSAITIFFKVPIYRYTYIPVYRISIRTFYIYNIIHLYMRICRTFVFIFSYNTVFLVFNTPWKLKSISTVVCITCMRTISKPMCPRTWLPMVTTTSMDVIAVGQYLLGGMTRAIIHIYV